MNCDGVRDLLSAYLDGELSPGELLRVEQHLRRCHLCADEVDSLRQVVSLVASLDEVEVPATFHAQLHDRLVAIGPPVGVRRTPPAWQRQIRQWALPAAAAAAVVAVGLTGLQHTDGGKAGLEIKQGPVAVEPGPKPADQVATIVTPPPVVTQAPVQEQPQPGSDATPKPVAGTPNPTQSIDSPTPTGGGTKPSSDVTPAPLGATGTNPNAAYTVSFKQGVTPAESQPTMVAFTYTLEAKVADPAAMADLLMKKYAGRAEVTSVTTGKAVLGVVILADAATASLDLAYIKSALGQTVAEGEPVRADLAAQFRQAYQRLDSLDAERDRLSKATAGITDPDQTELAKAEFAAMEAQAAQAKLELANLEKTVAKSTILVNLSKQAQ